VVRRFLLRSVAFVALVVPGTFTLALLASPATAQADGCFSTLQQAQVSLAAAQARVQQLGKVDAAKLCSVNQVYFLELVKTRAVTASCQQEPERNHVLGRLDADVEHINGNIAAMCH